MGTATYSFFRQRGGSHYAKVTVSTEIGGGCSVQVAETAFAWLKDEYGPNAWEGAECDLYRSEAISGASYALRHVAGEDGNLEARVVIDRIQAHAAHSASGDVEYATIFAVWHALGVQGGIEPDLPGRKT